VRLNDLYIHKETNDLIEIECFATRMNSSKDSIIVFRNVSRTDMGIGSVPSFNGYGSTIEEIENQYILFMSGDDLIKNYETWDDVFDELDKFIK